MTNIAYHNNVNKGRVRFNVRILKQLGKSEYLVEVLDTFNEELGYQKVQHTAYNNINELYRMITQGYVYIVNPSKIAGYEE